MHLTEPVTYLVNNLDKLTSDNGFEFAALATIKKVVMSFVMDWYVVLLQRKSYSYNNVAFVEDWMNTLPRRILKYKTSKELFELCLDKIYAIWVTLSI